MDKIIKIYEHLGDEVSKQLYICRMLYNMTKEEKYLDAIIKIMLTWCKQHDTMVYPFIEKIKNSTGKVIIYGAGSGGKLIKRYLDENDISIIAYCDLDVKKQNSSLNDISIISPEMLVKNYSDEYVLVCVFNPYINGKILENLKHIGIEEEKILLATDFFGKQYFDATLPLNNDNNGIFIDAGCYDLGTALEFRKWNMNHQSKIYSFEPDEKSYLKCKDTLKEIGDDNIQIFPFGVWAEEGKLEFEIGNNGITHISNNENTVSVDVVAIDNVIKDEYCSFVKMDVEGAELQALKGLKNTIIRDHPTLAISIYHKDEDILEIPHYILSLFKDYKFYIRHYSTTISETILYAVVE